MIKNKKAKWQIVGFTRMYIDARIVAGELGIAYGNNNVHLIKRGNIYFVTVRTSDKIIKRKIQSQFVLPR